jgi:hypothetical protein
MSANKAILEITKTPAMVMHINTRIEKHGQESVLAADIKIAGVHLQPEELNALLDDKHAHNALFKAAVKGKPAEPMFRQFQSYALKDKFKDCSASIYLGLTDICIDFEDVNISSVWLEPEVGGQTLMGCTVQAEIDDTDDIARLLEHLQSDGSVALFFGAKVVPEGKKAQGKLDLAPKAPGGSSERSDTDDMPASTH